MSTTHRMSRAGLLASCAVLAGAALIGQFTSVTAAPPGTIDAASEVRAAATALAPATRISMDPNKPIFPMQVTPRCEVLDNYGDARSSGRTHQGIDILATLGQEVYAVVDGTLGRKVVDGEPDSGLSGNGWRLTATNGKTWYVFMHLSGFAPGLENGSVVERGDVIGYVGDTGNPGPGNYHLHFETHPNGVLVNPLTMITVPAGCVTY